MVSSIDKIILGTVQLGLEYGISNQVGKLDYEKSREILKTAFKLGIKTLDTADAYGDSYDIIGRYHKESHNKFHIHTKFKSLPDNFDDYLQKTSHHLGVEKIDTLYFHSFAGYLEAKKGELPTLKQTQLGVSIYKNEELELLLDDEQVSTIQLPLNVLDHRGMKKSLLERAKVKGKTLAVRSAFLQGLFFLDEGQVPPKLSSLTPYLVKVKELAQESKVPLSTLLLNYPLYLKEVDFVLIGVHSKDQLVENINSLKEGISEDIFRELEKIKVVNSELLNPVNW